MLRGELLTSLEAELRPCLSSEELALRLAEIDAHLRDGIQGRVELGLSPEEAEREAVAAFGTAQRVTASDRARPVAVRLRWLAAAYATVLIFFFGATWLLSWSPYAALLPVAALLYGAAGLALAAFRARRAASVPILATGLAASVAIWCLMGATTLNLWNYGGMGFVARWEAPRLLQDDRARLAGGTPALTGANAWTEYARPELESVVAAIPQAQADPLGNWISHAGQGFGIGMGCAAIFGAVDLVAAGLGAAWAARRRNRRRPTVA